MVTLYKIGEVHFGMFGANGFHAKAKNETFTRVVVTTANMKISCRCFADYVVKISEPKSVPHVQHDYFFLIQPIKSLIFGVVVAVAFVLNCSP